MDDIEPHGTAQSDPKDLKTPNDANISDNAVAHIDSDQSPSRDQQRHPEPLPFAIVRNSETKFARQRFESHVYIDLFSILGTVILSTEVSNNPITFPRSIGTLLGALNFARIAITDKGGLLNEHPVNELGYSCGSIYYSQDGMKPERHEPANAIIIRLPHFDQDNVLGPTDRPAIEQEMTYHIIKELKDRLGVSPHVEWVLLDAQDFEKDSVPQNFGKQEERVTYNSVYSPHGYHLNDALVDASRQRMLIPLTRDELLDISLDTAELLVEFVKAIHDEALTALYERALAADVSERPAIHNQLIIHITRLLNAELRFKLETDMYLAEPQIDRRLPRHTKLSQFITIRRSTPGFDVVRSAPRIAENRRTSMNSELQDLRGGIRAGKVEIQLDDLLRTSDTPVRDILKNDSPYKRAQLLYLCDSLLRTADIDALFTVHESRDETMKRMKEHSIRILPAKELETQLSPMEAIRRSTRYAIGMIGMATLNLLGSQVDYQYRQLKDAPVVPIREETSSIPGELPGHSPIWHVESSDESIPIHGYWVEQTFDTFRPESASWIRSTESHEVDYPSDPPEKYIKVTRPLMFNQATTIPVKQGTRLSAIIGRTRDGIPIDVVTRIYPDGTVTAEYTGIPNPLNPRAIELEIYLEPTEDPDKIPLKLQPLHGKIDLNNADVTIKDLYAEAVMQMQQGNFEDIDQALAYLIQNRYAYGIDPASKKLSDAHSAEEFVKMASELKSMHCNTANSMLALLSQDAERTYVTGFGGTFVNKDNPQDGYLLASAGHGFTVDEEGEIRDATPLTMDGTDRVQADQNFLKTRNEWSMKNELLIEDSLINKNVRENALKFGEIAGSAIGLSLLARLTLRLKREAAEARRKPEVQQALDDEFLSSFEPEQVTRAVDFLLHISHHKEDVPYHDRDSLVPHEKPMDKIIQNCVIDRIRNYIVQPDSYEPATWLKSQQKATRAIAGYVINVHEIFSSLKK